MLVEFASDIAKLFLSIAFGYAALIVYTRRSRHRWAVPLAKRRLAVLGILTLVVIGVKLFEDVLAKESGPVDEALMWMVRDHVPAALTKFFAAVTVGGSAVVVIPVALVATVLLLIAKHRFEALLIALSVATAPLVVYVLKTLVGRTRPALWETAWYWGSSFPSGHTLNTAAFSTAAALCLTRLWPRTGNLPMLLAMLWTLLVALSRLVLGVHWPSDVLAATCVGVFIPLSISLASDLRRDTRDDANPPSG